MEEIVKQSLKKSAEFFSELSSNDTFQKSVTMAASEIVCAINNNKKILIAGNGGSAADAQHFAAELVWKFEKERGAIPALALTTDSSVITSISNDDKFDNVFARQVEAFGQKGDIFIGISTSGNSQNIMNAMFVARQKGMKVICLSGKKETYMHSLSNISINVPSQKTSLIQEVHVSLIHIICSIVEKYLK